MVIYYDYVSGRSWHEPFLPIVLCFTDEIEMNGVALRICANEDVELVPRSIPLSCYARVLLSVAGSIRLKYPLSSKHCFHLPLFTPYPLFLLSSFALFPPLYLLLFITTFQFHPLAHRVRP